MSKQQWWHIQSLMNSSSMTWEDTWPWASLWPSEFKGHIGKSFFFYCCCNVSLYHIKWELVRYKLPDKGITPNANFSKNNLLCFAEDIFAHTGLWVNVSSRNGVFLGVQVAVFDVISSQTHWELTVNLCWNEIIKFQVNLFLRSSKGYTLIQHKTLVIKESTMFSKIIQNM